MFYSSFDYNQGYGPVRPPKMALNFNKKLRMVLFMIWCRSSNCYMMNMILMKTLILTHFRFLQKRLQSKLDDVYCRLLC